jgi:cellulose synthase/poly-beta-1,6-N-acetylglucosamine synthase-like glycosyltransferase
MNKARMYTEIAYLFFIAATFGAVMVLGIFTAATIFNSEVLFAAAPLDHFSEGVIMAEIFRKFGYWCNALALAILLFELYEYKMFRRDGIAQAAAFTSVVTLLLFSAVYTPKILEMQEQGSEATQSEAFANIHTASEIDFKILAVALLVLFFRRVMLLRTVKV